MSSKKKDRRGKSIVQPSLKFVSNTAEQRFEQIKSLPLIFEREFKMEKRAQTEIYDLQIQALKWEILCQHRSEALLSWVYEFYSNAIEVETEQVTVRGKLIDFSAKSINSIFKLESEEVLFSLNVQLDSSQVTSAICNPPGPEWINSSSSTLKSTSLTREANVWLLFIDASIMPTRHLNIVTWDRATLIYHILMGNRCNIGKIINDHLKIKIQGNKVRQLWFPILITELCRREGVEQGSEDLATQVGRPISERVVEFNIKVGHKSEGTLKPSHKRLFMDLPSSSHSSGGKRETVAVPSGEGATLADILDNVEFIKVYLRCQHCYFRSRLDYLQDQHNILMQKAKLPIKDADFAYQWNFDDHGYLFDQDRNNLDPTDFVAHEQEKDSWQNDDASDSGEE